MRCRPFYNLDPLPFPSLLARVHPLAALSILTKLPYWQTLSANPLLPEFPPVQPSCPLQPLLNSISFPFPWQTPSSLHPPCAALLPPTTPPTPPCPLPLAKPLPFGLPSPAPSCKVYDRRILIGRQQAWQVDQPVHASYQVLLRVKTSAKSAAIKLLNTSVLPRVLSSKLMKRSVGQSLRNNVGASLALSRFCL